MNCGDCAKCPFAADGKPPHDPIPPLLPVAAQGVVVLEAPGQQDVEKGQLLSGSSGRALRSTLRECGLGETELAYIPAVACRPTKVPTDNQRRAATKACAPLFAHHYEALKSLPVLAAGKWAAAAVGKVRHDKFTPLKVKTERGFLRDDNTFLLTWPPQVAIFVNPWELGNFEADLRRFERMITGRLRPGPKFIGINATQADVWEMHAQAKRAGYVAIDIETRSPDPSRPYLGKSPLFAELKTIGFGTEDHAISMLWPPDGPTIEAVCGILDDPFVVKVFQNGQHFDIPVMRRYNLEPAPPIADTRTLRRTVSTTSPLNLAYFGSLFSDMENWKSREVMENEDDK